MTRPPLIDRLLQRVWARWRVFWYRRMSTNEAVQDRAVRLQPICLLGKGRIELGDCVLGYGPSPGFWSGYAHLEAREASASIRIGNRTHLNNGAALVAERASIDIADDCLIGIDVKIFDSDFHDLAPAWRRAGTHPCAAVRIERNVFIGASVTILKGVRIGQDSVVAAGALVITDVPARSIVAGVPARVVGTVPDVPSGGTP